MCGFCNSDIDWIHPDMHLHRKYCKICYRQNRTLIPFVVNLIAFEGM